MRHGREEEVKLRVRMGAAAADDEAEGDGDADAVRPSCAHRQEFHVLIPDDYHRQVTAKGEAARTVAARVEHSRVQMLKLFRHRHFRLHDDTGDATGLIEYSADGGDSSLALLPNSKKTAFRAFLAQMGMICALVRLPRPLGARRLHAHAPSGTPLIHAQFARDNCGWLHCHSCGMFYSVEAAATALMLSSL